MKKNFTLWIIGPSAAGKTSVSKIVYDKIKEYYPGLVLIDGDKVRSLYEKNLGYDKISRSKNTLRYISLVKWLKEYKISSIVAVISPFEKDRVTCRAELKNYSEIYLHSSLEERIKRDKKKLYKEAIEGKKKHVVDVDIPFESPVNADLKIDTEKNLPDKIADKIINKFNFLEKE